MLPLLFGLALAACASFASLLGIAAALGAEWLTVVPVFCFVAFFFCISFPKLLVALGALDSAFHGLLRCAEQDLH